MSTPLPLIRGYRPDAPFLWRDGAATTQAQFIGAAHALAAQLPAGGRVINLCEDRGLFVHAFAAALLRGATTLLPGSRVAGAVQDVARVYPDAVLVCDAPFADVAARALYLGLRDLAAPPWDEPVPAIDGAHVAAMVFTSGSTDGPQAHPKSWRTLFLTAGLCAQRFAVDAGGVNVVATVPPQHMYGLELSVMMALAGGWRTNAARPFFPDDVRRALADVPAPRLLVSTPVHLRALVESGLTFPDIACVVSATAPLAPALAGRAEAALATQVFEIYGCTEAGMMCTRRTVAEPRWRPYPGLTLTHVDGVTHVVGAHLDAPVSTPDVIETHPDGTIALLGRAADMVKVAGKRASLAELTGKLLSIAGVADGVVFLPAAAEREARPAALVVAPGLSEAQILDALARLVDPVFLPRRMKMVERLPRNPLGKLPRAEVLALFGDGA